MSNTKSLKLDAMIWILVLVVAAVIAFSLLKRDKDRNFGAVSFGSFPAFHLKTVQGDVFDSHQMKSRVWAIHSASTEMQLIKVAQQLNKVVQLTSSGKRHLYIASFINSHSPMLKPLSLYHYMVVCSEKELGLIFSFSKMNENSVVLVDQNSIIRGQYDISNVDDYRKFQQDLMRIL